MPYSYEDAYLKTQVTDEREARAIAETDSLGSFASPWRERLHVLRAYIIVCLECQAQPDDLFAQKLKHYRTEWDALLVQAQAAASAGRADGGSAALFTIAIERA